MNRRSFIRGAIGLVAAPAVVPFSSLMPVRGVVMGWDARQSAFVREYERLVRNYETWLAVCDDPPEGVGTESQWWSTDALVEFLRTARPMSHDAWDDRAVRMLAVDAS